MARTPRLGPSGRLIAMIAVTASLAGLGGCAVVPVPADEIAAALSTMATVRDDAWSRGDPVAWVSVIASDASALRAAEESALEGLTTLDVIRSGPTRAAEVGADVVEFTSHYRIDGVDAGDSTLTRRYRYRLERGTARLVARADAQMAPWELPGLRVVRTTSSVVASGGAAGSVLPAPGAPADDAATDLRQIATLADAALAQVRRVWSSSSGDSSARPDGRVLVVVPSTPAEQAALLGRGAFTDGEAPVATTVGETHGGEPVGGDRVILGPQQWGALTDVGRRAILLHEIVHVAVRSDVASAAARGSPRRGVPAWVEEGLAQEIAYAAVGLTPREVSRASRPPPRATLPADGDFDGGDPAMYVDAWVAARVVIDAAHSPPGLAGLFAVARGVATLAQVTGLTESSMTRAWLTRRARELA